MKSNGVTRLIAFLTIIFMGNVFSMKMTPKSQASTKKLIERERATTAAKTAEMEAAKKIVDIEKNLKSGEFFVYQAGTDNGIVVPHELLQMAPSTKSMLEDLGDMGSGAIPLYAHYDVIKKVFSILQDEFDLLDVLKTKESEEAKQQYIRDWRKKQEFDIASLDFPMLVGVADLYNFLDLDISMLVVCIAARIMKTVDTVFLVIHDNFSRKITFNELEMVCKEVQNFFAQLKLLNSDVAELVKKELYSKKAYKLVPCIKPYSYRVFLKTTSDLFKEIDLSDEYIAHADEILKKSPLAAWFEEYFIGALEDFIEKQRAQEQELVAQGKMRFFARKLTREEAAAKVVAIEKTLKPGEFFIYQEGIADGVVFSWDILQQSEVLKNFVEDLGKENGQIAISMRFPFHVIERIHYVISEINKIEHLNAQEKSTWDVEWGMKQKSLDWGFDAMIDLANYFDYLKIPSQLVIKVIAKRVIDMMFALNERVGKIRKGEYMYRYTLKELMDEFDRVKKDYEGFKRLHPDLAKKVGLFIAVEMYILRYASHEENEFTNVCLTAGFDKDYAEDIVKRHASSKIMSVFDTFMEAVEAFINTERNK